MSGSIAAIMLTYAMRASSSGLALLFISGDAWNVVPRTGPFGFRSWCRRCTRRSLGSCSARR